MHISGRTGVVQQGAYLGAGPPSRRWCADGHLACTVAQIGSPGLKVMALFILRTWPGSSLTLNRW